MRDIITIPATVEEVDTAITGAMEVFTLGEWPLAAWLAARVRLQEVGGTEGATSSTLTPTSFAGKGIRGLRSKDTVRRYVQAWLDQNDGQYPTLGTIVSLPRVDFPGNSKTSDTEPGAQKVRDVKGNASSVAKALEDPEFVERVLDRATPEAKDAVRHGVLREDAEHYHRLVQNQKARDAEQSDKPTWLIEILNIPIQMEQAGSRERRLLRGDPAAVSWDEESTALLMSEVDRAQAILDWLRTLPQMEAITPESIIGSER